MKILLIADASSIWTAKYVDRVLAPLGCEVVVLTSSRPVSAFAALYDHPDVTIRYQHELPRLLSYVPGLRGILKRARTAASLRRLGPFDVIHVQMVLIWRVKLAFRLQSRETRVILSYWGSDLLRRTGSQINAMRRYLRRSNQVTVNSREMEEAFRDGYDDLDIFPILVPFGVNGIEAIDSLSQNELRSDWCESLGLPTDRIILTVGYNGRPGQQHLEVFDAIGSNPKEVRERYHVVLPMTYGLANEEYCEHVTEAAASLGCGFTVLRAFLNEEQQARLCLATDLFVNAQKTDALSAALQEFLYAGTDVFSGSWLNYPELDEADVRMTEFDVPAELSGLLARYAVHFRGHRSPDSVRPSSIRARSWTTLAPKWGELYGTLVQRAQ